MEPIRTYNQTDFLHFTGFHLNILRRSFKIRRTKPHTLHNVSVLLEIPVSSSCVISNPPPFQIKIRYLFEHLIVNHHFYVEFWIFELISLNC